MCQSLSVCSLIMDGNCCSVHKMESVGKVIQELCLGCLGSGLLDGSTVILGRLRDILSEWSFLMFLSAQVRPTLFSSIEEFGQLLGGQGEDRLVRAALLWGHRQLMVSGEVEEGEAFYSVVQPLPSFSWSPWSYKSPLLSLLKATLAQLTGPLEQT